MKINALKITLCFFMILFSSKFFATDVYKHFHDKNPEDIAGIPMSQIDSMLNDPTYSVTSKVNKLPNVDPHDYVSYASYWWPNPNASDGLPYIRKDGIRNKELVEQGDAGKFHKMAQSVVLLTRAYQATLDEKYAKKAAALLRTWFLDPKTMMNPNVDHGQLIMGKGLGTKSGILELRYNISIIEVEPILLHSEYWNMSDHEHLKDWYRKYYTWLLSSKLGKQAGTQFNNNHGSWYDAQVMAIAIYLDRKDFARDMAKLAKNRRIATQIEPDGKQPEELKRTRSLFYSLFNLQALFAIAELADRVHVDLWDYETDDGRSIIKAYDYVRQFRSEYKPWPHKQIDKVEEWQWDALSNRHDILLDIFR